MPAIGWEPNRTSTLQHPRREFGEVSSAYASGPCSCSRRFFAKALHAGSHTKSDGWKEVEGRSKPCDYGGFMWVVSECFNEF